jgi:hypothetical protein
VVLQLLLVLECFPFAGAACEFVDEDFLDIAAFKGFPFLLSVLSSYFLPVGP